MRVLEWIRDLLFGTNGFDMEAHEDTVRKIKDESVQAIDRTQMNFNETEKSFSSIEIEREEKSPDPPDCLDDRMDA
jgi:hypothetical protein